VPVPSVSLADLVAVATTSDGYLARIADYTSVLPTWTAPAGSTGPRTPAGVTVTIGEIIVQATPGVDGRQVGTDILRGINEALGEAYRLDRLARGSADR